MFVRQYPCRQDCPWGTWCSGITSAPHAEGPGFKSQCVHLKGGAYGFDLMAICMHNCRLWLHVHAYTLP